jgi:hypothetical protein
MYPSIPGSNILLWGEGRLILLVQLNLLLYTLQQFSAFLLISPNKKGK